MAKDYQFFTLPPLPKVTPVGKSRRERVKFLFYRGRGKRDVPNERTRQKKKGLPLLGGEEGEFKSGCREEKKEGKRIRLPFLFSPSKARVKE